MMRYLLVFFFFASLLHAEDQISSHTIQLPSGPLSYTATVGSLPARDAAEIEKGVIGFISYIKAGSEGLEGLRPITFAFNGGPGSSSIWLHVGAFGPKRVVSYEEGQDVVPPYRMVDNLETLLDVTDLVFIDPIGTGLSHAKAEDAPTFYDTANDIRAVSNFIRDYLTTHQRWNSPKYLAGESYGTLRACGVANDLQSRHCIYLNGIILISCAIDYQTFVFHPDNQLPYFLFLPTYATTAWYHGRYNRDLTIEEVAKSPQIR